MALLLLGFTDALLLLDKGIAVRISSMAYLNAIYLILFIVFFLWRYRKEMQYLGALDGQARAIDDDWLEALPRPEYFRDELVSEALYAADRFYRRKLEGFNAARRLETDDIAAWVHEIKAPLTAMKLAIDANQRDPVLRKIESEWLRVYLLVDRQLYISRLPSLESDYVLEETSVQRLAAAEVRELASWCMEKNIAVEIEGEAAAVITDVKWCRFIIRQLFINAVKYSPAGGAITIGTEVAPAGNVVLRVKDEGPGIPAHDLPRIFDKGFTGGNGRIHNAATGLGLYLARNVGAKIGIAIEARSDGATGTVMMMRFATRNDFEAVRE